MPIEFRMAWREIRPTFKRFIFMIAAIALGVGCLTGIKGFSESLEHSMVRSARELIAADIAVRMTGAIEEREEKILDAVEQMGAQRTRVTETLSMAVSGRALPVVVNVKAVDPVLYPFYGTLEIDPDKPLRDVLNDSTALASPELLIRTGAGIGDELRIGGGSFRIAGILKVEPDRLTSGIELGPRVLITRGGMERGRLIQFGTRAAESHLYRLSEKGPSLETVRGVLAAGLRGRVRISDFRNPNPNVSRELERMTNFLSLIGLLALLVGGIGVATTIHSFLQQKLDSIAIIKCLGGRSFQIIRIYLIQGLLIGTAGSLLGVGLGYVVQLAFPPLVRGLIQIPTKLELASRPAVQGFAIGILTTFFFLLPPLLAIRKVRPIRVFLRDMPDTHYSTIARLRHDALPLAASCLLLLGVGGLASWLADSWRAGLVFIAGLSGAIAILAAGANALLMAARRIPRPKYLAFRHGLKNLYRPGGHVTTVIIALGIGVGFTFTVYLLQTSLLSEIVKSAPADFPNVFIFGIGQSDRDPLWGFLTRQSGVIDPGRPIPSIPARLQTVDGKTADQLQLDPADRRFFQIEFILTWAKDLPPHTRITDGSWWKTPSKEPLVSVGIFAARRLKISLGSSLKFLSSGKVVQARVACLREVEFERPGVNNQFIFSPGVLEELPSSYVGAVRVRKSGVAELQKALFETFPNVTSIDIGQVLVRVQELVDKIASIIRFVAFFAILGGITILASSVASTRYQRIREAVLMKTLGATRGQVRSIHAAEFLIVGLASGFLGCLLASAAASYLLVHLLDTPFNFRWLPVAIGTLFTAALVVLIGWIATRGILNQKPMAVLREN